MFSDPKFWIAASFIIFLVLAGKAGWTRITEMLDARSARIRDELDEAKRLRAEAQAMMARAEADRTAAIAEAADLIARAKAEAERLAATMAAEAAAVTEVRNAAADLAAVAVRDVISAKHDAAADEAMLDKTIKGLPSIFRAA